MILRHRNAVGAPIALWVAMLSVGDLRAATSQTAVALEYSAVEGCPDIGYFKSTVGERFGAEAFADNAPTRVIVRITATGQTFEGSLEWLDAQGKWVGDRTFPAHSHDCEDLVRAMAFTLALQLQLSIANLPPAASPTPAEVQPAPGAPRASPTAPTPATPVAGSRDSRALASEPHFGQQIHPKIGLGVGTLLGFGMASSALPFARVFGSVAWPYFYLEVASELSLPTTTRRRDGAGFWHQELLASVAGCEVLRAWRACLLVKAGEIRVIGKDIDVPASAAALILETGLRVGATQYVYRNLFASAYAEGLVLPILWTVTLDQNAVWTSPRFAGTLGLDVGLRFE